MKVCMCHLRGYDNIRASRQRDYDAILEMMGEKTHDWTRQANKEKERTAEGACESRKQDCGGDEEGEKDHQSRESLGSMLRS